MPWELEIVHVDLHGSGDATLIVARDGARTRSVLVDGGRQIAVNRVHAAVVAQVTTVDVIATTHYDGDHCGGVACLLSGTRRPVPVALRPDPPPDPVAVRQALLAPYAESWLFDQGQPNVVGDYAKNSYKRKRDDDAEEPAAKRIRTGTDGVAIVGAHPSLAQWQETPGTERPYQNYEAAAGTNRRVTTGVLADQDVPPDHLAGRNLFGRDWLLGTEIMWHGQVRPAGAPTLRCVAANQWVRTGDTTQKFESHSAVPDRTNAKSLAFLLEFERFRYYVGGDLESAQERVLGDYLNPGGTTAGRVHAMKASHHGSKNSSPAEFLRRMLPQVVIISCSRRNQYGHPDREALARYETLATGVDANGDPIRCVQNYFLTGDPTRSPVAGRHRPPGMDVRGIVAGPVTNATESGTVTLRTTAAEAAQNPPVFHVSCRQPGDPTSPIEAWRVPHVHGWTYPAAPIPGAGGG